MALEMVKAKTKIKNLIIGLEGKVIHFVENKYETTDEKEMALLEKYKDSDLGFEVELVEKKEET